MGHHHLRPFHHLLLVKPLPEAGALHRAAIAVIHGQILHIGAIQRHRHKLASSIRLLLSEADKRQPLELNGAP